MDPPDPPLPPPSPPPPQPAAKRPSASYADALRGQKVFAPKSQTPRNINKPEFPQPRKQSQGHASPAPSATTKATKQIAGQPSGLRTKPPKATKAGRPQVGKSGPVSELPPMPPQLPPPGKFQESTYIKKVPVTRSSYAQALSGTKPPALPLRSDKDNHQNQPVTMGAVCQNSQQSISGNNDPKSSRPSKAARKLADAASRQPQPAVPAGPGIDNISGKHKGKPKSHHSRKSSSEWKRRSSSSVWEATRNEANRCAAIKDRGRRFSMGDGPRPAVEPEPSIEADESFKRDKPLDAVEEISEEERSRLDQIRQRAERMASVIAMHDNKDLCLWECQYEWDVLIVCQSHEWRVHHDILCRESDWFKERLPPKDSNLGYVRFELENHSPEQLGSVLHFMYTHNYPNAIYSQDHPLHGEPIRVNVFKFICGTSVNCSSMMRFAFDRINEATDVLSEYLPRLRGQPPIELFTLYDPLGFALAMMYDQGSRPLMLPLRQAMANLVDVTIMDLILNLGFKNAFEVAWVEYIYPNLVNDSLWFTGKGLLGPPPTPSAVASQRSQDHNAQQHVPERAPPRYRNKSRDLDGPWRRNDARLESTWRHEQTPFAFPTRPGWTYPTIYLPRSTEGPVQPSCQARPDIQTKVTSPPGSEDRAQPFRSSEPDDLPRLVRSALPEDRSRPISSSIPEDKPQPIHSSRSEDIQWPQKPTAPVIEKPVPHEWGVWDASTWERIEHRRRDHSRGTRRKPQSSDTSSTARDHHDASNNAPALQGGSSDMQSQVGADEQKDTWALPDSEESQATPVRPSREKEVDEESLIDLDIADQIKDHDDWDFFGNPHPEHDATEEIKRPQSVSGDWGNPWDSEDTWRPAQSGKGLSTRPGEEEDERSTITTFTPVTSAAGDDVICESIVFEEEQDDGSGDVRALLLMTMTL